jgi:hypothetical protein
MKRLQTKPLPPDLRRKVKKLKDLLKRYKEKRTASDLGCEFVRVHALWISHVGVRNRTEVEFMRLLDSRLPYGGDNYRTHPTYVLLKNAMRACRQGR